MTERDYARKLDELDRILNDPEVPMEASLVWSLLDELRQGETSQTAGAAIRG